MDPVSFTATIGVLHLAAELGQHVAGHEAHTQLHRIRHAIAERLQASDLPLNHDLQQASSEAFRQATKCFYLGMAASVEPTLPLIPLIIDHLRKGTIFAQPLIRMGASPQKDWLVTLWRLLEDDHAVRRLETVSLPAGTSPARLVGDSPSSDIAGWLHQHLMAWLNRELPPFPDDPLRVSEIVTQGWFIEAERRVRITFFEAWCLFFREQVKRRTPVFNILVAQGLEETRAALAHLDVELGAVPQRLDEILAGRLNPLESWLEARFEELCAAAESQAAIARSIEDDKRRSLIEQHFLHVDAAFVAAQREEPLRQSLQAPVGDWAFACHGMAVPRDLEAELVPLAVANEEPAALLLIRGDPGAGKSVLMRRVAIALIKAGRAVYELRWRSYRTQDWYSLIGTLRDERRPAVLLIDDIFRCPGIEDFFKDPDARCFVVATTRSNEDQSRYVALNAFSTLKIKGSDGKPTWPRLSSPTETELRWIRDLPSFQQMTDAEWGRLSTTRVDEVVRAAPMLVLMIQIAGRDAFERIVSKTVRELREKHPPTYEALGVVSVFHRLGLNVPSSLLGRLIENAYFMEALFADVDEDLGHTGAHGLLFHDRLGAWHTGHEMIAEAIAGTEYPYVGTTGCLKSRRAETPRLVLFSRTTSSRARGAMARCSGAWRPDLQM